MDGFMHVPVGEVELATTSDGELSVAPCLIRQYILTLSWPMETGI